MSFDNIILPADTLRVAERLLGAIEAADSMLQAVKCGARAEGFVLGLETARSMEAARIEALYVLFDEATEKQLKEIADGQ
jgi:hypothetical protein